MVLVWFPETQPGKLFMLMRGDIGVRCYQESVKSVQAAGRSNYRSRV